MLYSLVALDERFVDECYRIGSWAAPPLEALGVSPTVCAAKDPPPWTSRGVHNQHEAAVAGTEMKHLHPVLVLLHPSYIRECVRRDLLGR